MDRTTEDGWDGQMSLETSGAGFSVALQATGEWCTLCCTRWLMLRMALGRRTRFILHASAEEFEASRQNKVSFSFKFIRSEGLDVLWHGTSLAVRARSRLTSGCFSTDLHVFMYQKSSPISLVGPYGHVHFWELIHLQQYDEYFAHLWLCFSQFSRHFQVAKNIFQHGPAGLETLVEDVMEKNSIYSTGATRRCSERDICLWITGNRALLVWMIVFCDL